MAVSMRVQVLDHAIQAKLKKLGKLDNLRTPLKQSGVYMEGSIGKRFRKADWKGLSPATIARHPRREGGKPLNDTGLLKRTVTSQAVKHVNKSKLIYGTVDVSAPLHNFGGQTKFGYVPARPFLYFDEKDEKLIRKIFEDYVKGLVN